MNIRGIGNNGEWLCCSPIILRKKELKIDTLYFENTEELANSILEQYENFEEYSDDFCGLSVIAHYQIIVDLINYLVKNTSFEIANVQIEEGELDNYYDEWILNIDPEGKLWCQEAIIPKNEYNDGGYVYCEEDAIFVHGDVNSKFIVKNEDQNLIAFEIGEDEDSCDCDCENCELHELESENETTSDEMPGFSYSFDNEMGSTHISFYSTDKDLVEKMAKLYME